MLPSDATCTGFVHSKISPHPCTKACNITPQCSPYETLVLSGRKRVLTLWTYLKKITKSNSYTLDPPRNHMLRGDTAPHAAWQGQENSPCPWQLYQHKHSCNISDTWRPFGHDYLERRVLCQAVCERKIWLITLMPKPSLLSFDEL